MDLFEAIEKRASVRSFAPVDIPEDHLRKILEAGRRAPSGKNLQPIRYVVARSKDTLSQLDRVQKGVSTASAAIVLVGDPSASPFYSQDASAATENMLLAIKALGYDSVWIEGTLSREEEFVKELLGIPSELKALVMLPIGKAVSPTAQKEKLPLDELVHWDRW